MRAGITKFESDAMS